MPSLQRDSHVRCFRKNFIHSYVKFFVLVETTDLIVDIVLYVTK